MRGNFTQPFLNAYNNCSTKDIEMRQMQGDSSSLSLPTLFIALLRFEDYGSYCKKTAKISHFVCKVAPVYGNASD